MNKHLKIAVLIVIMLILSIGTIHSQTEKYKFRHLTTKDGLSSHYVKCIAKDSRGFMWFGTSAGLNRFDGYNIKEFRYNPDDSTSISNSRVLSILEVDEQLILFATSTGGLNLFNVSTEEFIHFKHDPIDPASISNNRVNVIYKDQQGLIWAGTDNGLNIFELGSGKFKVIKQDPDIPDSKRDYIYDIFQDSKLILWIATADGLYQLDKGNFQFKNIPLGPKSIYNPESNKVRCVTEDTDSTIWIGTSFGLYTLKNNILKFHGAPDIIVNPVTLDIEFVRLNRKNQAWIATNWGLFRYDFASGHFDSYYVNSSVDEGLSSNLVHGVFYDGDGLLWLYTYNGGVDVINIHTNPFQHFQIQDSILQHSGRSFAEDSEKNIWVGSNYIGLLMYDSNMNLKYVNDKFKFSNKNVYEDLRVDAVLEDSEGTLWVGVGKGENRICTFNKKDKIYQPVRYDTTVSFLSPQSFNEILEDKSGKLWIASNTGLFLIPKGPGWDSLVHIIDHEVLSNTFVHDLHLDRSGNVWVAADSGLFCTSSIAGEPIQFVEYKYKKKENEHQKPLTTYVYESRDGTIWIGSVKLCIADKEKHVYQPLETSDDLLNRTMIISMKEDNKGYLWLSTWKGLVRFDPLNRTPKSTRLFNLSDGLPYDGYFRTHMFQNSKGVIFMPANYGTMDGFYCFHPDSILINKKTPPVVITDIKINNTLYKPDSSIIIVKQIQLDYNQNFLSFEFAALDYTDPSKNQYAYQLTGIDEDWIYCNNRRYANYTGLPPGEYVFRVKGTNNDGYWNEEGTSLSITILPPLWKTWWAYLLYGIFIVGILFSMVYYYLKRLQLLRKLEMEHVEAEKLKELDSLKTRFFANISHEFRTPLTLILGPLEKILSKAPDNPDKKELSIAKKNAKRLLNLINQILTITKLDAGKMKLHASEINAVAFVKSYINAFESLARQKKIDIVFNSEQEKIKVFIDKEKFEQVLNNLLSNAFKFTKEGGKIIVSITLLPSPRMGEDQIGTSKMDKAIEFFPLEGEHKRVEITISDTGIGIPSGHIEHVFDHFYQVDESDSSYYEGTGIGLALVRELVKLHHGEIQVESELGKGTIFTILLPLGKEHLKPEEIVKDLIDTAPSSPTFSPDAAEIRELTTEPLDIDLKPAEIQPILLIVEDNTEMRNYIRGFFETDFRVIEAVDGEQGIEKATEFVPDIVISDVMMPKIDGFVFCEKIKTDERTSHIPVILLTARASTESRIEGLETGADDFITKPFEGEELKVRVRNLINQRKRLREIFGKKIAFTTFKNLAEFKDGGIASMDEKFLKKAFEIVENEMTDPEFSVLTFSNRIGLSRMQLHRKIKALTDQSPSEFIKILRLNKSAVLLKSKSATAAEIAYDVGFNSPSYFSTCFKEHFGKTPLEFAEEN